MGALFGFFMHPSILPWMETSGEVGSADVVVSSELQELAGWHWWRPIFEPKHFG